MEIDLNQAELCDAIAYYLNNAVVRDPLEVKSVKSSRHTSTNLCVTVICDTFPEKVKEEVLPGLKR